MFDAKTLQYLRIRIATYDALHYRLALEHIRENCWIASWPPHPEAVGELVHEYRSTRPCLHQVRQPLGKWLVRSLYWMLRDELLNESTLYIPVETKGPQRARWRACVIYLAAALIARISIACTGGNHFASAVAGHRWRQNTLCTPKSDRPIATGQRFRSNRSKRPRDTACHFYELTTEILGSQRPKKPAKIPEPSVRLQFVEIKRGGAQGRSRTADTAIFSRMLYQLSYLGIASLRASNARAVLVSAGSAWVITREIALSSG